jgi:hypothetical protein
MSSKYRADSSIASNKASLKLQSYTNSSGKSQQYQDLTRSLQETLQAANQAQLTASRQG